MDPRRNLPCDQPDTHEALYLIFLVDEQTTLKATFSEPDGMSVPWKEW